MNNAQYWARRFKMMEDAIKDKSYDYIENLNKQFDTAIKEINLVIRAWYQRFADNNGISYTQAQKLLVSDELKEFKWTVEKYIEKAKISTVTGAWAKELENASARVHISRLDNLKYQLRQKAEELTQSRIEETTEAAKLAYTQSYYHTAFEIQKGFEVGWTVQSLNDTLIEKILSRPWTADNKTFTARCWTDKEKLVQTVNRELTRMAATGAAPDKAIENISKQFNVSKQNAGRVVMTESAYFSSAAQKDCYKELDVEYYKVVSALDSSTCELCQDMDGKIFKISEYEPGSTANPFHPWCRCCTSPYYEDLKGVGERYANDITSGKSYTISKDITYKEWKALQDKKYGTDTVDRMRKMGYNEGADKKQFERYKNRLGSDAPKTFKDFQNIKYDKPEEYKLLCGHYAYKESVPEATISDYKEYKAVKSTGVFGSVRVPSKNIDVNSLTFNDNHAIHHGCTLKDAKNYVKSSKCSITRKKWDGYHTGYYSKDGATYIDNTTNKIKTSFSKKDFDDITNNILEVFK